MKEHMTGFVPVDFRKLGVVLLVVGMIGIGARLASYFGNWLGVSDLLIFVGATAVLLGLYLIFVVPKVYI